PRRLPPPHRQRRASGWLGGGGQRGGAVRKRQRRRHRRVAPRQERVSRRAGRIFAADGNSSLSRGGKRRNRHSIGRQLNGGRMIVDEAWVQRNLGFNPVERPAPQSTFAFAPAAKAKTVEDLRREMIDFDSEGVEGQQFLAFTTATGLSRFTDIPWPKG